MEEYQEERESKQKKQNKKPLDLVVKIFPRQRGTAPVLVEFSPDDTQTAERLDKYLGELRRERRFPDLGECSNLCRMFGSRARCTQGESYIGHIFEDGEIEAKVQQRV